LLERVNRIEGIERIRFTSPHPVGFRDDLINCYGRLEKLCESKGISNDTTVVFYGDKSNWWACYAFWTFKLYGHENCKVMNGGRKKWELEGRDYTTDSEPEYPRGKYTAKEQDLSIRSFRDDVLEHIKADLPLVDVRSEGEFSGELFHMEGYPQEGSAHTRRQIAAVVYRCERRWNIQKPGRTGKNLQRECGFAKRWQFDHCLLSYR